MESNKYEALSLKGMQSIEFWKKRLELYSRTKYSSNESLYEKHILTAVKNMDIKKVLVGAILNCIRLDEKMTGMYYEYNESLKRREIICNRLRNELDALNDKLKNCVSREFHDEAIKSWKKELDKARRDVMRLKKKVDDLEVGIVQVYCDRMGEADIFAHIKTDTEELERLREENAELKRLLHKTNGIETARKKKTDEMKNEREKQICDLLNQGYSKSKIAERLGIDRSTVYRYIEAMKKENRAK